MFPMHGGFMGRGKGGCPLPQNFPGLSAWYDGDDSNTLFDAVIGGSNVTTNGATVARWEDKTGNGNHLTQSTLGLRPTLNVAAKNGRNAIEFDGVDEFLTTGLTDLMRSKGVVNAFIVLQDTNVTGGNALHIPLLVNAGGNARAAIYTRFNSSAVFRAATRRITTDTLGSALITPSDTNYNILGARFNYSSGGFVFSKNARLPATTANVSIGITGNNQGEMFIGNVAAGTLGSNFKICEIMMLEDPVVDDVTAYLECIFEYFQNKWDITP